MLRALRLLVLATMLASAAGSALAQKVRFVTTLGEFVVELDAEKAPRTTQNFVQYVKAKHFDGTVFHRVIASFMIQGGGFRQDLTQKPTRAPIELESRNGLSNLRGTIAMARTSDPNSATAQFFINVVDNPRLDADQARDGHGYAVFGRVVDGMDVIDRIKDVPVAPVGAHQHVPQTAVVVQRAFLEP